MLNFLKYDPASGAIVSKGFMQPELIDQLIAAGEPYIKYSGPDIDVDCYKYDTEKGQLVEITPVPPPAPELPTVVSFISFMNLFTKDEQLAIASSDDDQFKLFRMMATGAGIIDMGSQYTVDGVNYMAAIGIIKESRVAEILSMTPPK